MRGSVVKKGNRWYVIIERRDAETGKRKRQWHSGYRTKKEAEASRVEILSRLQRGAYVAPTDQTLGQFLTNEWLTAKRATVRPSTIQSYEQVAQSHIIPALGSVRLQEIRPSDLNRLYSQLLSGGRRNSEGGLSPKTVRNVHVIIRKCLADAVRWARLAVNPADNADPPRLHGPSDREHRTWTAEELRTFLRALQEREHPLHSLFTVAATTGMRRGELLGLRWRDVDLEAGTLSISQTLISVAYEIQYSTPKTRRGHRLITIDAETATVLREQRVRQAEQRLLMGEAWTDTDLVFTKANGQPLHPDFLSQSFQRLVDASDLPRIRLHDLRHTHATLALQAGIHPKIVSERLGHATVSITLDTYSHVIPSLQTEVAEAVAKLVFGGKR